MTWTFLLWFGAGVVMVWLIGANIMHDVFCRYAIDGIIEMRARKYSEDYISSAIQNHHDHLAQRVLLWPISGTVLLIGVIKAARGHI